MGLPESDLNLEQKIKKGKLKKKLNFFYSCLRFKSVLL